jgi:hypothetical protein
MDENQGGTRYVLVSQGSSMAKAKWQPHWEVTWIEYMVTQIF